MAILAKLSPPTANVDTLLYRVPNQRRAVLNMSVLNRHTTAASGVRIALVQARDMIVDSALVTQPGSGYTAFPTITVVPPEGNIPSTAATLSVVNMQAATVAIEVGGSGYTVDDVLELQGGTATPRARVRVESVGAGGVITSASIVERGIYTVLGTGPRTVTGGAGTGASFTLTFGIREISLTNKGQGYSDTPTLSAPGGTGFTCQLVMVQAVENNDYIEFDVAMPASAVLERTGLALSAGDAIFVRAAPAGLVNFIAIGFEEVA